MAVEVALEDDLFFADLNRQISLLIDEEDDHYPVSHFPSNSQNYATSRIHHHPPILPTQFMMYQQSCRREMCKGTGVFIPQSSQPRRKNKQGKRSSQSYAAKSNSNNNKQLAHSKGRTNNVAAHTNPPYATNCVNQY